MTVPSPMSSDSTSACVCTCWGAMSHGRDAGAWRLDVHRRPISPERCHGCIEHGHDSHAVGCGGLTDVAGLNRLQKMASLFQKGFVFYRHACALVTRANIACVKCQRPGREVVKGDEMRLSNHRQL